MATAFLFLSTGILSCGFRPLLRCVFDHYCAAAVRPVVSGRGSAALVRLFDHHCLATILTTLNLGLADFGPLFDHFLTIV
jgi:hypothetical protein